MRAALVLFAVAGLCGAGVSVRLTPEVIRVGAFYDGAQLRIEGTAGAGSAVVAAIRGAAVDEIYNRKGRVGPIWINTEKVHITGVPSLFFAFTSAPLSSVLNREAIDRHRLDQVAIKAALRPKSGEVVRASYMSLKAEDGSYRVMNGALKLGPAEGTMTPYSADFHWPKKAPPGTYEVEVYECRDGAVTGVAATELKVEETGFPAMIASLATGHSSAYGALSVLVAILAGFGIDFLATRIFKKRVAAH